MPRVRILESKLGKKSSTAAAPPPAAASSSNNNASSSMMQGRWDDSSRDLTSSDAATAAYLTSPPALDERDKDHEGQHQALCDLSIMNTQSKMRLVPNGPPTDLSNDCFDGKVMLMIRTPEVDDLEHGRDHDDMEELGLCEAAKEMSHYFKGKKRRFEFQFQIKLKKIPEGPLFLGCELEHAIKIGTLTKGLVGILLAMVRRINPGFHYAWGPSTAACSVTNPPGAYEKTHLSFPVEASMDRIVITKPGQPPPTLGQELMESNDSVKRRRKTGAGAVDWNLDDTYTMCLWSAYCDWIKWKSLNVPGVSPFLLSRVTGTQPIYLSVYEITGIDPHEYKRRRGVPHYRKDLNVYTRLEFAHQYHTTGGLAEKLLGKCKSGIASTEQSLPDTESLDDSDFETASRATV